MAKQPRARNGRFLPDRPRSSRPVGLVLIAGSLLMIGAALWLRLVEIVDFPAASIEATGVTIGPVTVAPTPDLPVVVILRGN